MAEPPKEGEKPEEEPIASTGTTPWMLSSQELGEVVENQRQTLADLQTAREQLSALNKNTEAQFASHGASFARATRIARDLQSDMSEIMRRLSVVKTKLDGIQPKKASDSQPQ